jgi:putative iron-dependent peroxidase
MLTNMFVGNPPGTTDRLLDFSTALTGNLFFAPTVDVLEGGGVAPAAAAAPTVAGTASDDGSLRIGSLRGGS